MSRKYCSRAALLLATLSPSHPLRQAVIATVRGQKRLGHKSPVHRLLHTFHLDPRNLEPITPARLDPKWIPRTIAEIKGDPASAAIQDTAAELANDVCIYSDGSGIKGRIGSAAVLRRNGVTIKSLRFDLGSEEDHTVFEGELVGMILAVHLLKQEHHFTSASLALDNQPAILSTSSFKSNPGQYFTGIFHNILESALNQHGVDKITVRWTPAHTGIPGNEEADGEAKRAARGDTSDVSLLPLQLRGP